MNNALFFMHILDKGDLLYQEFKTEFLQKIGRSHAHYIFFFLEAMCIFFNGNRHIILDCYSSFLIFFYYICYLHANYFLFIL